MTKQTFMLICCCAGLAACGWFTPRTAIEYGDELATAMDKFESTRQETAKRATEASEVLTETLERPAHAPTNMPATYAAWKTSWDGLEAEAETLKTRLGEVERLATPYFASLEQTSAKIGDRALREQQQAKNQTLKSEWATEIGQARRVMAKLDRMLLKGRDIEPILALEAARNELQQTHLSDLKSLTDEASTLMDALSGLHEEGQNLFAVNT